MCSERLTVKERWEKRQSVSNEWHYFFFPAQNRFCCSNTRQDLRAMFPSSGFSSFSASSTMLLQNEHIGSILCLGCYFLVSAKVTVGGALNVIIIVIRNRNGDPISNPKRELFMFQFALIPLEKPWIKLSLSYG